MTPAVLAAAEGREASPVGLVVVLCLLVAVVLLIRSMNKHLRRLPPSFADRDDHGRPLAAGRTAAARPEPGDPDSGAAGPGRSAERSERAPGTSD